MHYNLLCEYKQGHSLSEVPSTILYSLYYIVIYYLPVYVVTKLATLAPPVTGSDHLFTSCIWSLAPTDLFARVQDHVMFDTLRGGGRSVKKLQVMVVVTLF